MLEILGYILAALAGVSLGLTGGGGSVLTVPILVYAFGIDPLLATSYSLFIVGSTSVAGAVINYRKGFVQVAAALLLALSSISIVFLTRKILLPTIPVILFDSEHFQLTRSTATMVLFGILMLVASIAMIKDKSDQDKTPFLSGGIFQKLPVLLLYGAAVGLITG
ncbi:MAG: TSUP family transporter, partial [Flavitalea sp.]